VASQQGLSSMELVLLVRTSQETFHLGTKISRLMLFKETTALYCENPTKYTNTLFWQNAEFSILKRTVRIVTTGLQMVDVLYVNIHYLKKAPLLRRK
jgi:hypothetical protein